MKTKIFLLVLIIIIFSACSAEKIVVDEMTITDPDQFIKFKNEKINVSTKDVVTVRQTNPITNNTYHSQKILKDQLIKNYNFSSDSLFINDPYFHSALGIKTISAVKFKGIWDNDLGFVSEDVLNKHLTVNGSSLLGGILGAAVGSVIGFYLGGIAGLGITNSWDTAGVTAIILGTSGLIGGGYLGSEIFSSEPLNMNDVIKKIKEEQKIKNEY